MILKVRISDKLVLEYHENGMPRLISSNIIKQDLEIVSIRKIGFGGGCCYEAKDQQGRWHNLYKSDNPGRKIPVLGDKGAEVYL